MCGWLEEGFMFDKKLLRFRFLAETSLPKLVLIRF